MRKVDLAPTRPDCPWCSTRLTGEIEKHRNMYKLDNGDPDFVERTACPNCGKWIFTINKGRHLVKGYENVHKTER